MKNGGCCPCQSKSVRLGLVFLVLALAVKKLFIVSDFITGAIFALAIILLLTGSFGNVKCSIK